MLPTFILAICLSRGFGSPACMTSATVYYGQIHGQKYVDKFVKEYTKDTPTYAKAAGFIANATIQRKITVPISSHWKADVTPNKDVLSWDLSF